MIVISIVVGQCKSGGECLITGLSLSVHKSMELSVSVSIFKRKN